MIDKLKSVRIEPWNWYDLARVRAYFGCWDAATSQANVTIGTLPMKEYIESISVKDEKYTVCIEKLLDADTWDEIDSYILLDGRSNQEQIQLAIERISKLREISEDFQ
jgi:hypothetical protein